MQKNSYAFYWHNGIFVVSKIVSKTHLLCLWSRQVDLEDMVHIVNNVELVDIVDMVDLVDNVGMLNMLYGRNKLAIW